MRGDGGWSPEFGEPLLQHRHDRPCRPLVKSCPDDLGPPLLLARVLRETFAACQGQVRRDRPDVVGEVDIFGEAIDDAIGLRQRRPAFEDQMRGERRREEGLQRPDDPDVLLEQMHRASGPACHNTERVCPFVPRQAEEALRHRSPPVH